MDVSSILQGVYNDVNKYISSSNGFADAAAVVKMWEKFQNQLQTGPVRLQF